MKFSEMYAFHQMEFHIKLHQAIFSLLAFFSLFGIFWPKMKKIVEI